jgi:pimeloyl-ACP methyl ester carboxylesterase
MSDDLKLYFATQTSLKHYPSTNPTGVQTDISTPWRGLRSRLYAGPCAARSSTVLCNPDVEHIPQAVEVGNRLEEGEKRDHQAMKGEACAMRSVILAALLFYPGEAGAGAQEAAETKRPMFQHEFVTVNGIKLHYVAVGQGQVILFLHGFPEFWYAWNDLLPEFGRDYRAVAVDMRGYNLSDKPVRVEDYAVPLLVADVKGLLERLSPGKKAILVGHDWGGAVAYAFALTHPQMLEKLVIINAPHPAVFARELRENPQQRQASAYMNLFRSPQAEATLSANNYAMLAMGVFGGARPGAFPEEKRRRYLEAWAQPGALTGGLNYYRAARVGPPTPESGAAEPPEDLSRLLPSMEVRVPTLVIWGEKDTALLTGNLNGLQQYVPNLTVRRIPDAGHWVVHEEPQRVTQYIRAFLGGR